MISPKTSNTSIAPQNPRFIRAKDLKRIYGITARVLAGVPGAPKPIKVSRKVVLFRIADLDFYLQRCSGKRQRGISLGINKKSGLKGPLNGSSLTALSDSDTQEKEKKAS